LSSGLFGVSLTPKKTGQATAWLEGRVFKTRNWTRRGAGSPPRVFCEVCLFCTGAPIKIPSEYPQTFIGGLLMRQIFAIAGFMVLALVLMDSYQVVKAPSGLSIVKAGQALAADLGRPPPPPVVAPVGKGKYPIGKGKGKAPPPVVTKG